ncbi:MAG: hypothetical protein KA436_01105 [Oligoflexales bacterium]|nr:hypothetical protein [Oligoflexales bacterium]
MFSMLKSNGSPHAWTILLSILVFCWSCSTVNLLKKKDKSDPLLQSSRELERGKYDLAYSYFLTALPSEARDILQHSEITPESVNRMAKSLPEGPRRSEILGLFSVLLARRNGVNILEIAEKISKIGGASPQDIIKEISSSLTSDHAFREILAALEASNLIKSGSAANRVNASILYAALVGAKLKSVMDSGKPLTVDSVNSLSNDDATSIYTALRGAISSQEEASQISDDPKLKNLTGKLQELESKIMNAAGQDMGEKTKNFLKSTIEALGQVALRAPPSTEVKTPAVAAPLGMALKIIDGKRVVRSAVTFGDSLAVGIGSDFSRGETLSFESIANSPGISKVILNLNLPGYNGYHGDVDEAVIEKYDSAYSASPPTLELCRRSFHADKCFSHPSRLKAKYFKNYAQSGSQISDIESVQIPKFIKDNIFVDYVAVNIGGNDFCSQGFDLEKFRTSYTAVLSSLYNYRSAPIILVAGIPNVVQSFTTILPSEPAFQLKSEMIGNYDFTCGDIRYTFCRRAIDNRTNMASQSSLIDAMTELVSSVIKHIDPTGKRIFFAQDLTKMAIDSSMVSIDCFHTNTKGYRMISDVTFAAVEGALAPNDE